MTDRQVRYTGDTEPPLTIEATPGVPLDLVSTELVTYAFVPDNPNHSPRSGELRFLSNGCVEAPQSDVPGTVFITVHLADDSRRTLDPPIRFESPVTVTRSLDMIEKLAKIAEGGFVIEGFAETTFIVLETRDDLGQGFGGRPGVIKHVIEGEDRVRLLLAMKNRQQERREYGEFQQGYKDAIKEMQERLEAMI